ncbi:MAG TPA: YdeI/OmpD-associated family protein [Steroidobacteraceae bacterium]|jgi:hypothetical protein
MATKVFKTTLVYDPPACFIPLNFDVKRVFGKLRVPVKVTLNGYTYRSTIASMGSGPVIPLRKSNREAAGLTGTETLEVRLELDEEERTVTPPPDLEVALKKRVTVWRKWQELSYTHQREYVEAVEGAKRPETRERRIQNAVEQVGAKATRK